MKRNFDFEKWWVKKMENKLATYMDITHTLMKPFNTSLGGGCSPETLANKDKISLPS